MTNDIQYHTFSDEDVQINNKFFINDTESPIMLALNPEKCRNCGELPPKDYFFTLNKEDIIAAARHYRITSEDLEVKDD